MLQIYRGLVQPHAPALGTGLPVANDLRSRKGNGPEQALNRKPKNCLPKRGNLNLLRSVQPTEGLFRVARTMFQELWTNRMDQAATQKKALEVQLAKIDGQVSQLLTRILDVGVPSVIGAYEDKVRNLEGDKLLIKEKLASAGRPVSSFDNALRTALAFLANPCKLWASERLDDRRAVLKLAFADRLRYKRNEGFRTANLSLPLKVLADFFPGNY